MDIKSRNILKTSLLIGVAFAVLALGFSLGLMALFGSTSQEEIIRGLIRTLFACVGAFCIGSFIGFANSAQTKEDKSPIESAQKDHGFLNS